MKSSPEGLLKFLAGLWYIVYYLAKQPWAVLRLDSRMGGKPMTVLPFSQYELLTLVLTAILVYITWKHGNTKK